MSRINEAIQKLEAVLDRHICFSRREELEDVLNLLKEEQASMKIEPVSGTRIGAVVHGPEIVDSGNALRLIDYLKKHGSVTAVLGGTMGRVAVIDAGLESVISFSPRRRPSRSIQDLAPNSDVIFLLNQAKSRETGLAFGCNGGGCCRDWKASDSDRLRREVCGRSLPGKCRFRNRQLRRRWARRLRSHRSSGWIS